MEAIHKADTALISHDYIFVETATRIQNRLGMKTLADYIRSLWSLIDSEPVKTELRGRACTTFLAIGETSVSLVDCVSFLFMEEKEIRKVYGFDRDFKDHGFEMFP